MKFKVKLLFTYSLVVMVLIILAGVIFGSFSYNFLEQTAHQEIQVLADSISRQMDETVRSMIFMTDFILSDSESISAINMLGRVKYREIVQRQIAEAKQNLYNKISTNLAETNFHRIVYFNSHGDILSSNSQLAIISDGSADLNKVHRLSLINASEGEPVLLPPYIDPWSPREPKRVFGIVRLIMGNDFPSYLEVQKPFSVLESFHSDESESTLVGIANGKGEIFHSQFDEGQENFLLGFLNIESRSDYSVLHRFWNRQPQIKAKQNTFFFRMGANIVAVRYSPFTDTYSAVIRTAESIGVSFGYILWIIVGLCSLVCLIAVGVIYILSLRITAPVARLVSSMELTNLDNINNDMVLENTNDEFVKLYKAYNRLLSRLSYSINQEKHLNLLHLQAEFNTLQTQINPHFLYNVLSVLSHRGVINGDETVCRICEELAAMMRYSAEVSRRMVSVREELEYVEHYLYLLKTRYQKKLNYKIEFDTDETGLTIPKMVVQPLVENSINHGFKDKTGEMDITIKCRIQGDEWQIAVEDNGSGFAEEVMEDLVRKMRNVRQHVKNGSRNLDLDIGGMGLINIYARIFIIYGDRAIFRIECREKGVTITVGAEGSGENV